jgi:transglutaminase-like putative cysteine protease
MKYRIHHTTTYQYAEPVSLCHNLLHLQPRACPRQLCQRSQVTADPEPGPTTAHLDYFGNPVTQFTIQKPHRSLTIAAQHAVEVLPAEKVPQQVTAPWEQAATRVATDSTPLVRDAYQFTFDSLYIQRGPDLAEFARPSFPAGRPLMPAVLDLTKRIHAEFRYDPRATTLTTPIRTVLRERHGVCQDFAHLQIGCLRSLGLAARYVSGYLRTQPQPDKPGLVGADASHAWVAVFCPELGWFDVDPTNNLVPSDAHITLAWGRDYDDVSPIKGIILGGASHTMTVAVEVTPQ